MPSRLTRTVSFLASHRMEGGGLRAEEAERLFGRLTSDHSHLYRVDVTVAGEIDPVSGLLLDLAELDRQIATAVTERMADASLNDVIGPATGQLPTCEALARWIWHELAPHVAGSARLDSVRVAEDDTLSAEYRGRQADQFGLEE